MEEAEKKSVGRPSDYTDELAESICLRLAEGESLRSVCRDEEMPCKKTVLRWISRHPSFRAQYVRAKEEGAEAIAEELFDIADDGTNDWMEKLGKDGEAIGYQINGEHVQRSKLRIDTRKWYLSKIMPKKYGDKIQHEQNITIKDTSDDELDRRIKELMDGKSGSDDEGSET
ncbi:DNA packaging protein [Serratia fonticola]|uniref:terminase small subunit-like protein n=1 Tax=Serratia fonticola TaxID=47917 RepID=UPI001378F366|nr:DNA packaging protein [Serratia fonticola]NBJ34606.1 DNA packaging protein [Serratia fonticola]